MFDWIYQLLVALAAKVMSWFGFSFGASKNEEAVSASTSSDSPPAQLPSGPAASDLSNTFSSQASSVA